MMIAIVLVCGTGAWPCAVVVASETSSLQLRGLTQGVGAFTHSVSSSVVAIILPYIFNPDQGDLRGKTGFLFSALCVATAWMAWVWVPEMKGRSAAEIDDMFEAGLPSRKFKGWEGSLCGEVGIQSGSSSSRLVL